MLCAAADPAAGVIVLPAVSGSGTATVTCNKPVGGWPTSGFTVSVKAQAGAAGCQADVTAQTVVTTTTPSTVTVALKGNTSSSVQICATSPRTFSYTVTSSPAQTVQVNVSATNGVTCTATPASGASTAPGQAMSQGGPAALRPLQCPSESVAGRYTSHSARHVRR